MMTAGYPEQGGGGPTAASATHVGAPNAATPQPGPHPNSHGGPPVAPAAHDQCLTGQQPLPPDHHAGAYHDQAQFEVDKRSVYKHPLFPLLALLFEKCEIATQSADCISSDSFNLDIQAFVQHQERDRKPFLMNDPEVDGLMIKAIQVLRIHLLELEKVQELCKDFCNRYITCLKGKMQSENLLRSEYGYDSPGSPDSGSPYNGHHHQHHIPPHSHHQVVSTSRQILAGHGYLGGLRQEFTAAEYLSLQVSQGQKVSQEGRLSTQLPKSEEELIFQHQALRNKNSATSPCLSGASRSSPCLSAFSREESGSLSPVSAIQGSTPLSQIAANPCPPPPETSILNLLGPLTPPSYDEEEDSCAFRRQKRGILPKHATAVMKAWLFQHIIHPYPSEDEKRQIAAQTNLTLLQVNNWFINARRRILQPMIDSSNPLSPKIKKSKSYCSQKSTATRFWPNKLSSVMHDESDEKSGEFTNSLSGSGCALGDGSLSLSIPEFQKSLNDDPESELENGNSPSPGKAEEDLEETVESNGKLVSQTGEMINSSS